MSTAQLLIWDYNSRVFDISPASPFQHSQPSHAPFTPFDVQRPGLLPPPTTAISGSIRCPSSVSGMFRTGASCGVSQLFVFESIAYLTCPRPCSAIPTLSVCVDCTFRTCTNWPTGGRGEFVIGRRQTVELTLLLAVAMTVLVGSALRCVLGEFFVALCRNVRLTFVLQAYASSSWHVYAVSSRLVCAVESTRTERVVDA